jgi:hypothetical protein
MNTTFVTWSTAPGTAASPAASRRCMTVTWRRISPTVSCRRKPAWPVAQKGQPSAHPAWVEMHTVARAARPLVRG